MERNSDLNDLSGWQVSLSIFRAADRAFQPISDPEVAAIAFTELGCKLEWAEDAESGIYVVTLNLELHRQLLETGFIDLAKDDLRLQAEVDLDQVE